MAETMIGTRSAFVRARLLTLLVACVFALAAAFGFAAPRSALAATQGSFAFAVVNESGTAYVIEPTLVPYESGQTVKDALEAAPELEVSFNGGFINDIKGNGSSLVSYYTGGWNTEYQYDIPASDVSAVFCTYYKQDGAYAMLSEDHASLLALMGTFLGRTDGVRNYTDAQNAFNAARNTLRTGDAAACVSARDALQAAIDAYEALMSGEKYDISFEITQRNSSSGISLRILDKYGNETLASGSDTVELLPGSYRFWANTADNRFGVYGEFEVVAGSGMQIDAAIPYENWVASIDLYDLDDPGYKNVVNPTAGKLSVTGTFEGDDLAYLVPDYARETNSIRVTPRATSAGAAIASANESIVLISTYTNVSTGATYTTAANEATTFDTTSYRLPYLVKPGAEGATATFEMTHTVKNPSASNCTTLKEIERSHATFTRTPSLSGLSVTDNGTETIAGFASAVKTYEADAVTNSVVVTPTPMVGSYTTYVNGQEVGSDGSVEVALVGTTTDITVVVDNNEGATTSYTVSVAKRQGVTVSLTYENGTTAAVQNAIGSTVTPTSATDTQASYLLIPGDTYMYIGTKGTYYHTSSTFTAAANASIAVPTPNTTDLLTAVQLRSAGTASSKLFDCVETSTLHESTWRVWDTQTTLYLHATRLSNTSSAVTTQGSGSSAFLKTTNWKLKYTSQITGASAEVTAFNNSGFQNTTPLVMHSSNINGLHASGASGQTALLEVDDAINTTDDIAYYQDYFISLETYPTLNTLDVINGSQKLVMTRCDADLVETGTTGFVNSTQNYSIEIPDSVQELKLQGVFTNNTNAAFIGGYVATVGGQGIPAQQFSMNSSLSFTRTVPLNGTDGQLITVKVTSPDDPTSVAYTYTVKVKRLPTTNITFETTPADATVNLVDNLTGQRIMPNSDGEYQLTQTYSYTWSVGAVGYKSQGETIIAGDDTTYSIALQRAPVNPSIDSTITGVWPSFRLGDDNLSSVDRLTPTTEEDAVLYWAAKLGQGYDSGAAGCPILVDGYLYTYGSSAGRAKIFKVDTVTGETVAEATMAGSSSFGINPATYAEGMIFIGEAGGRVEAFNAETLESLWVYVDPRGGQPNCSITYKDGCIYTGFWTSYTGSYANFVCITIDDEDVTLPGHIDTYDNKGNPITQVRDQKRALWTHLTEGGYYWAGACARDDGYVLMGADDGLDEEGAGALGTGHVYSFDSKTGELLDDLTEFTGDVRTQITYDADTDYYYFMTKSGFFCRVKCNADGTFNRDSFKALNMGQEGTAGVAQCTTTPAFANGRAYLGVRGTASFGINSGHHIAVVDLTTFTVAYSIPTLGYVQATPVVVTGHQSEDGYTYVYFIENYSPGKMRVIRDKPGMFEADDWSVAQEEYVSNGQVMTQSVARAIFTPKGSQAQFAICSPIVDEYGIIYFKNDSAYMMALGPTIESINVTTPPARTEYLVGETFDPAGMAVTATYSNGLTRDISAYVTYDTSEFTTAGEKQVYISFPHTMYQTRTGVAEAIPYVCPDTSVTVTVGNEAPPTVIPEELEPAQAINLYPYTTYPYSHQFRAPAMPAVTSWAITGTLPSGLTFDTTTGTLSGTPALRTGGSYTFSLTATNSLGDSLPQEFTLTVHEAPTIVISSGELTVTQPVGAMYSYSFTATGYPEARWLLSLGELPDGLELASDGTLSGRLTKAGVYTFTVKATNGVEPVKETPPITFTVTSPAVITTNALVSAETGMPYEATLAAEGTPAPTWALAEGSALPAGLALNAETGVISGTPTQGGTYTFTVTAANDQGDSDSRELTLIVGEAPAVTTTALEGMTVGQPFELALAATGYPNRFTWTQTAGALPRGVALASDGTISGTPAAGTGGSYAVTVQASNGVGTPATKAFDYVVTQPVEITTTALHSASKGEAYTATLEATGYPNTITWALSEGVLPEGLSLDAATGVISGTPSSAGNYTFTVAASNGMGDPTTAQLSISVVDGATIVTTSLEMGVVGQPYAATITVAGNPAPTLSLTGNLPDGLTFDASAGTISGTPTATGVSTFTLTAFNGIGEAATCTYELVVGQVPAIETNAVLPAVLGAEYEGSISTTGYPAPKVMLAAGSVMPAGLTLAEDGSISGTPTEAGDYLIEVEAENSFGLATKDITLQVAKPAQITTLALPAALAESPYSLQLEADTWPNATWTLASGTLPEGLTLSADGVLSGTPAAGTGGAYAITVSADNGVTPAVSKAFTLTVNQKPQITTTLLEGASLGESFTTQLAATGYPNPTFSIAKGSSAPAGLTLSADGVLSGTPSTGGLQSFQVTVANAGGTTTQIVQIMVNAPAAITTTSLPEATVGTRYQQALTATGEPTTFTWSIVAGELPAGLTLDAGSGSISGTPTTGGSATFTAQVENGIGEPATREFTIKVRFAPTISTTSLPGAMQREAYSAKLEATGYPTPTWSLASGSTLPAGLTLASNGTISGTPARGGTYTFTVVASNGVGDAARKQFTLEVVSTQATIARIAGENYANETAAAISRQAFPEGSDWVVIARDDDFADALGAVGLAGARECPILLTDRFGLSDAAAAECQRLGATHAYIIGGTGAIKTDVDAGLAAIGVKVEPRIWGDNSYDTSLACAKEIERVTGKSADTAIIAMSTNFQDALSMSPYAYKYAVPVVLQTWGATSADRGFTSEAQSWLQGKSVLVAGGAGAISDASIAPYRLTARLWGDSGYDTSNNIAEWMVSKGYLEPNAIVVACGAQAPKGVDALAGAALAGKLSAPMLLANTNTAMEGADTTTIDKFATTNAETISETYVLGGAYVMPQALYDRLQALTDAEDVTQ